MIYQVLGIEKMEFKGRTKYNMYMVQPIGSDRGEGYKPLQIYKSSEAGRYSTFPYVREKPDIKVGNKYHIYFNQYGDIEDMVPVEESKSK